MYREPGVVAGTNGKVVRPLNPGIEQFPLFSLYFTPYFTPERVRAARHQRLERKEKENEHWGKKDGQANTTISAPVVPR